MVRLVCKKCGFPDDVETETLTRVRVNGLDSDFRKLFCSDCGTKHYVEMESQGIYSEEEVDTVEEL